MNQSLGRNISRGQTAFAEKIWIPLAGLEEDTGRLCLIKGMLSFMAVFGCIGGVLSELDINYNIELVAVFFLASSLLLAFLRSNRILNSFGLIALFLLYLYLIMRFREYANSGFQVFNNAVNRAYSEYFNLTAIREAEIIIDNSYMTVTIAAMFIGFFLNILLSIVISNHMSLLFTVLLTVPVLMTGLYIERPPSLIYYFMILSAYVSIALLGGSGHISPAISARQETAWNRRRRNFQKSDHMKYKIEVYAYHVKGSLWIPLAGACLAVTVLFMLFTNGLYGRSSWDDQKNALKDMTDEYVKIYIAQGINGFTGRYQARGGVSRGKLGGVSGVLPTYQTDLLVTLAPYGYEDVYLRAYIGSYYMGNAWLECQWAGDVKSEENIRLRSLFASGGETEAKMTVENIAADPGLDYQPYYTLGKADSSIAGDSVEYYPYMDGFVPEIDEILEEKETPWDIQQNWVYGENFPEQTLFIGNHENWIYWGSLLEQSLFTENTMDFMDETEMPDTYQEAIFIIKQYLSDHYSYTMNPGKTPEEADFVEYFLTEQKEGYCTHFASAATLMFRALDIPARYVEGYVIRPYMLSDATTTEAVKTQDYQVRSNAALEETGVLTVAVPDAAAHAWVEIYVNDFGWMPVEVTPPTFESGNDRFSVAEIFSRLFLTRGGGNAGQTNLLPDDGGAAAEAGGFLRNLFSGKSVLGNGIGYLNLPLWILFLSGSVLLAVKLWKGVLRDKAGAYRAFRGGNYEEALRYHYRMLVKRILRADRKSHSFPASSLPAQTASWLKMHIKDPDISEHAEKYLELFEECCFSGKPLKQDTVEELIRIFKKCLVRK